MKKRYLWMILCIGLILGGCVSKEARNQELGETVLNVLDMPSTVEADLGLPMEVLYLGETYGITWTSLNPNNMSNTGIVTRGLEDQNITLKARVVIEGLEVERSFSITVLKDETLLSTIKVAAIQQALDSLVLPNQLSLFDEVNLETDPSAFAPLEPYASEVLISWTSSKATIVDSQGNFVMPAFTQTVMLEATISIGNIARSKTFQVEAVGLAEFATELFTQVELPEETSSDITLPTSLLYKAQTYSIVWISSDADVLSATGQVEQQAEDEEVILSASVTIGTHLFEQTFVVLVRHDPVIQAALYNEFIDQIIDAILVLEELTEEDSLELVLTGDNFEFLGDYQDQVIISWESSHPEVISALGIVEHPEQDTVVELTLSVGLGALSKSKSFEIDVKAKYDGWAHVEEIASAFDLGFTEAYQSFELPSFFMEAEILWFSLNTYIVNTEGVVRFVEQVTPVTLFALFIIDDIYEYEIEILIQIVPIPDEVKVEWVIESIELPLIVDGNIELLEEYDYGVQATWTSTKDYIIHPSGRVHLDTVAHEVTLTVVLQSGDSVMSKNFEVETAIVSESFFQFHNYIDRAEEYLYSKMDSVMLSNDLLVLAEGKTIGTYEAEPVQTQPFNSLVASWAAVSTQSATVEVLIRVRVDGNWSKYFSYRPWGLGLNNASINDSDAIARLSVDEVLISNSRTADAFQYKVVLRRSLSSGASPRLSLVTVALDIPNYSYPVNISGFPSFVDYDVPKLSQRDVPTIGGVICSPTSATMLLNFKGHSFLNQDSLQHRYISGLFRDYGANIYGNWVYNTVGMGAYGENAYVARFYSFAELQKHLIEVGPISASIRGNVGLYNTSGHLIVVRGYRITETGSVFVIVNDPWIDSNYVNYAGHSNLYVYYEFPLATFMSVWRGVAYIIE